VGARQRALVQPPERRNNRAETHLGKQKAPKERKKKNSAAGASEKKTSSLPKKPEIEKLKGREVQKKKTKTHKKAEEKNQKHLIKA